jgi:hypothetical protein
MFYLKRNLPGWERALRIMLGLSGACAAFLFLPAGAMMWLAVASGVGFALTGVVGFCPACALVGRRLKEKQS